MLMLFGVKIKLLVKQEIDKLLHLLYYQLVQIQIIQLL